MAHFARIDDGNIVGSVMPVVNEAVNNLPFPESEPVGQAMLAEAGFPGRWIQCSYVASFRGMFPAAGFIYDPIADVFMPPGEIQGSEK